VFRKKTERRSACRKQVIVYICFLKNRRQKTETDLLCKKQKAENRSRSPLYNRRQKTETDLLCKTEGRKQKQICFVKNRRQKTETDLLWKTEGRKQKQICFVKNRKQKTETDLLCKKQKAENRNRSAFTALVLVFHQTLYQIQNILIFTCSSHPA
jgi:hypothetical protein